MSVIVFAVGRPGSGKSTAVRHMMDLAKLNSFSTIHIRDYTILKGMSEGEEHKAKFRANEREGFDVVDLCAFDIALDQLMLYIDNLEQSKEYDVIFIEFARKTYKDSFEKLNRCLSNNYYILFVEAQLETCIKRIDERTTTLRGPDHHFISDEIMMSYYNVDNLHSMNDMFAEQLGLSYSRLKAICNDSSLKKLKKEANDYAQTIFQDVNSQKKLLSLV